MTRPRVVLGFQGVQMPANALRGIGRWCTEYTRAVIEVAPDVLVGVSVDDDLPLPHIVSELPSDIPVFRSSEAPPTLPDGTVFHVLSALEDLPIRRLWPMWARDVAHPLVATVYDMIPLVFPEDYFTGGLKRLLEVRYELYRQCGATISISETTALDAQRLLGLDPNRCFVAPGGISHRFTPGEGPRGVLPTALGRLGITPGFVLSIGNVDPRKNLTALIRAYASLPETTRSQHQLVLTCSQADEQHLHRLISEAASHDVAGDVVLLPYVDDAVVLDLFRCCSVMVYPSLYEGLGLPLIEASACGAPVLCSDVGPMAEIVRDQSCRFEPTSIEQLSVMLLETLTDDERLKRMGAAALEDAARYSWKTSIFAALDAYELAARR